jgi:ABC-type transport system substrate-binding protein
MEEEPEEEAVPEEAEPEAVEPTRLVVATWADKPSLDAHLLHTEGQDFGPILYDRLVGFDENSNIIPELATEWDVSDDGRTWTFKIREGQNFHDGTPVNAEAIKANFERLLNPETRDFFIRWTQMRFMETATLEAVDDYTFRITTEEPYPLMLFKLADITGSIVSPTAAAAVPKEEFGQNPVGSGPYKFVEWVPNTKIVFEKFEDHWLADTSNVDVIEIRIIPEVAARAVALETGEVDFVEITDPSTANRFDMHPDFKAYKVPVVRNVSIYPNLLDDRFSDERVRWAMSHAIDRQAIVDALYYGGFATVADSVITPGVWGYSPQDQVEYNPELARELLAEAGYPDGFEASLRVPTGRIGGILEVAAAVTEMFREIGIELSLDLYEHTAWVSSMRTAPEEADYELSFWTWGTNSGEPDYAMRLQFHSDNWSPTCCNRNFYSNPEVDVLVTEATSTMDDADRAGMYAGAQEQVWDDQVQIVIFNQVHTAVGREDIEGIQVLPIERWLFRSVMMNE